MIDYEKLKDYITSLKTDTKMLHDAMGGDKCVGAIQAFELILEWIEENKND